MVGDKKRYSFVVGADLAFFPAANALLNSLDYIGFDGTVNLIVFKDFPEDYLDQVKKKVGYGIMTYPFSEKKFEKIFEGKKADYMKRYRYLIAAMISGSYDACCFLDVDMFFVRPVDLFFEIASHGILLGAAKTGKVRYGGNPSYYVDGEDVLDKPVWNEKDVCCCPIFFNQDFEPVFHDVYHAYTTDGGRMEASDLFAINLMILKNKADRRMLTLPCHSWVGTNEVMLKPYTRVIEKEGQLISENGDLVYSVHGKWFSPGWHAGQVLHMESLIEKHLGNDKYWRAQYRRAMDDIMRWYLTMQHWILDINNWPQYVKQEHFDFMEGKRKELKV